MQRSMWSEACATLCDADGRIVEVIHEAREIHEVRQSVDTPTEVPTYRHGDPRFYDLLNEIAALHSNKSFDYTPAGEPLANFHRSERFGVPAWKGALVRIGDKLGRLEQLSSGKEPKNESLRDTLVDMAVYSLLCVLLLEDAK